MLKKSLIILISILLTYSNAYGMSAKSAIAIEADSGKILYEHNAYEQRGMASTTKIMTALVVLDKCNLDDIVTVSYRAASTEGSSMYLTPNEKITVEGLLYGLMLSSGNDAATALAEHISNGVEEFAVLMNEKAKEIGMNNTSFSNPHGLDNENHYSTAYDMAILTQYAMKNDKFKEIVGTKKKTLSINDEEKYRYLTNHNKLLSMYDGCLGVKTGFTKKCGRCLVSYAEKNNVKIIVVTLNDPDDWNDHITLYNNCFAMYNSYSIIEASDYICSAKVENSQETSIKLYSGEAINLTLTEDEYKKINIDYEYPNTLEAPIHEGQKIGKINIRLNDKVIASSDIITKYGIPKKENPSFKSHLVFLFNNLISLFYKSI